MCDGEICEPVTQQAGQTSSREEAGETEAEKLQSKTSRVIKLSTAIPLLELDLPKVAEWQVDDVNNWASNMEHFSRALLDCLRSEAIDGEVLLSLSEDDVREMRYKLGYKLTFGELKKFWLAVFKLQHQVKQSSAQNSISPPILMGTTDHLLPTAANMFTPLASVPGFTAPTISACPCPQECPSNVSDCETYLRMGRRSVSPEYFKTAISLGYSFLVTWITSFVMVIVHERVPDMKRYPPLPDIFLDNVPHIPWAFNMCEITGSLLFTVWMIVLIFHKYRMVLLRRFFALAGTVFLLRCVTMLITSLSVPGTHLQCNQKDFAIDDPNVDMVGALLLRMTRAYRIWSGLGMSIQGVRTCGDYMFSGHTVALTLLNFFITEYTPRNLYFLHTLTWLLNMFGIFFILAAHEHYSIDVFVAFYITSRLFLYYHTLSNNRALMQSDSNRTRIWFPMFSYFESSVDGIIPNDFDTPGTLIESLFQQILWVKDQIFLVGESYKFDRPLSAKSSMQIFGTDPDRCVHAARGTASSYLSPRPSTISGFGQQNSHTHLQNSSSDTPTPTPQAKTVRDASVDPYISSTNATQAPLKEKKLL